MMKKLSSIMIAGLAAISVTGCAGMQQLSPAQMAGLGGVAAYGITKATGGSDRNAIKWAVGAAALGYYMGFKEQEARALQAQLNQATQINFDLQQENNQLILQSTEISAAYVVASPKKALTKKMFADFKKTCDIANQNGGDATIVVPQNRAWMAQAVPTSCKAQVNDRNTDNIVVVLRKRA